MERSPSDPLARRTMLATVVDATDRVITQARALVRAIEAIGIIEPSAWFERAIAGPLLADHELRRVSRSLPPTGRAGEASWWN